MTRAARSSILAATLLAAALSAHAGQPHPSTFSIVAADPEAGEVGVAVASRFFAVGTVVPHAEAGVGAVATQSTPGMLPEVLYDLAVIRWANGDAGGARAALARAVELNPNLAEQAKGDPDLEGLESR